MNRVQYLTDEADDPVVFFQYYTRKRAKTKDFICVIEGKDDPKFYTNHIFYELGGSPELLSVDGKSNVLSLRSMLKNNINYKNDLVLYFIDRDYDLHDMSEGDLYVTPTYSIENFYCTALTFSRILDGECGLSKADDIKRDDIKCNNIKRDDIKCELMQAFNDYQLIFHNSRYLNIINAIFFFVRTELKDRKISLDSIANIKIELRDGKMHVALEKKKNFDLLEEYKKQFFNFIKNNKNWSHISKNPKTYYRGKQELLFMRFMLNLIKSDGFLSKNIKEQIGVKIKTETDGMSSNILSSISQYVVPPPCLKEFLRHHGDRMAR